MNTLRSIIPAAFLFAAATSGAATLEVTIDGVRTHEGTVQVAVLDAAGWAGKAAPVAAAARAVAGDAVKLNFPELAPGRYAIKVMHDENGNGKLDTNFMGMPTEGYGFSNNPAVTGQPGFDAASFELEADGTSITIHLR